MKKRSLYNRLVVSRADSRQGFPLDPRPYGPYTSCDSPQEVARGCYPLVLPKDANSSFHCVITLKIPPSGIFLTFHLIMKHNLCLYKTCKLYLLVMFLVIPLCLQLFSELKIFCFPHQGLC